MSGNRMSCAEVEVLLADYVDQTLLDREASLVKAHLAECAGCRELAADAAAAVAFMDHAAAVEAPPELVNRILFEIGQGAPVKTRWSERLFGNWLGAVLQPRFAMGMAMTLLWVGMLIGMARAKGVSLSPGDLYASAEDHVMRTWDRGVKYYQNLKIVYELQARYQEWAAQQDATQAPPQQQPDSNEAGQQ